MDSFQVSKIIDKVQASGCLAEDELSVLKSIQKTVDARSKIDDLDREWAVTVRKYVQRRSRTGAIFLPNEADAIFVCVIGLLIASFGLYMLCQFLADEARFELNTLFFVAVASCGVWMIYQGCLSLRLVQRYEMERRSYQTSRLDEESRLAQDNRPAHRVCPNCLSKIQ